MTRDQTAASRLRALSREYHLAQGPLARPPSDAWLWHVRLDQSPFGIRQISFVTQPFAAMLPPSPHPPRSTRRVEEKQSVSPASFDHLVGTGEERGRDGEVEGFRGPKIDSESVTLAYFDGEVTWVGSGEDAQNVSRRKPAFLSTVQSIARESAISDQPCVLGHGRHAERSRALDDRSALT